MKPLNIYSSIALYLLATVSGYFTVAFAPAGIFVGTETGSYRQFIGIKYAHSVSGGSRFQASTRSRRGSRNVHYAFKSPPMCPQISCESETDCAEECLFLNLYAPSTSTRKLPVMIWIHGGSFVAGSIRDPAINGQNLANEQNVIVITLQYRLGSLGFFSSQDVQPNAALTDIINGIEWVRENVDSFGGDRDKITLFGQSSGATAIRSLLTSKLLVNQIHGAILQSDPAVAQERTKEEITALSESVLDQLDCGSDVSCIKQKSWTDIVEADYSIMIQSQQEALNNPENTIPFMPTIDSNYVGGRFADMASSGSLPVNINMIFGSVKNEGIITAYTLASMTNESVQDLDSYITSQMFVRPMLENAAALAASKSIYVYKFSSGAPYPSNTIALGSNYSYIAHQDDIELVFGTESDQHLHNGLGNAVRSYWGQFAWNGHLDSSWPAFSGDNDEMEFGPNDSLQINHLDDAD